MAEIPLGIASWPGIFQVLSADFTFCQGISPSACTLEITPQSPTMDLEGLLVFTCGDDEVIFPGCRVDSASYSYTSSGQIWRLSIWDRRWRWRFGSISGSNNERHDDVPAAGNPALQPLAGVPPIPVGTIDAWTQQRPRQMAASLLQAMGETVFDVSQLPNGTRPEGWWNHDNPAHLLANLAEALGCRVVLGIDNIVRVVRTGVGASLPSGLVLHTSDVVQPPVIPSSLLFVGGKTRYQVDFRLEPVGMDMDGTIRPIEQLSYRPAQGWGTSDAVGYNYNLPGWVPGETPLIDPATGQFINPAQTVLTNLTTPSPRLLARRCIYHWYRISMKGVDGGGGIVIPGRQGPRIRFLWQLLPIEEVQVQGYFDETHVFRPYPARVWGTYYDWGVYNGAGNSKVGALYYQAFSVDKERGIIVFDEPTFLNGADGPLPAPVGLRCAVCVQDAESGAFDHYEKLQTIPAGDPTTRPQVVKREEVVLNVIPIYNPQTYAVQGTTTNQLDCDTEANYAMDAASLEYQLTDSADATYPGIVPISPDGAIWQVTWSVGPQGRTTRIARNSEWNPAVPSYRERRMYEKISQNNKGIQVLQDQTRRERGG